MNNKINKSLSVGFRGIPVRARREIVPPRSVGTAPFKRSFLLLLALLLSFPGNTGEPETILFGIHPYLRPSELLERFSPLADHLAKTIGHPVRIKIAKDYQSHNRSIIENCLHIAYLGPVSYVQIVDAHGHRPILARLEVNGEPTFRGAIISRRDSGLNTLADLRGKRFAFGDPNSTMGHLVPRHLLLLAGIDTAQLGGFAHLDNHMNVALGVLAGLFDAGAVKEGVFHKYEKRGLRVLAWTPAIAEHVFLAGNGLSPRLIERLRSVLRQLPATPSGLALLTAIKPTLTGLSAAEDGDYDNLRLILKQLTTAGVVP